MVIPRMSTTMIRKIGSSADGTYFMIDAGSERPASEQKRAGLPPRQTRRSVSQPGGRKSHSSALKGEGGGRKRSGAEESWAPYPLFRAEARLTTVLSSPWSVLRSTCNSLPKIDPTLNLKEFVSVLRAGVQAPAMAMEKSEGARRAPPLFRWGSMKEAETAKWSLPIFFHPVHEHSLHR